MADPAKSIWRTLFEFCGHFSTAIWIVTVLVSIVLWFLTLPPLLKGGIGSLLISLSVIGVANKIKTERSYPVFLTLGDLRGSRAKRLPIAPRRRRPEPHDVEIGELRCSVMSSVTMHLSGASVVA